MPTFSTAGSQVFIGGEMEDSDTDLVAADFSGVTWVPIGRLKTIGRFGDTSNPIESSYIDRARVQRRKGVRNGGELELSMDIDLADAGQLALVAAERSGSNFAIKIEMPDKPTSGSSPKSSSRMFIGLVMGVPENLNEADSMAEMTATIAINSNIVRTAASAS